MVLSKDIFLEGGGGGGCVCARYQIIEMARGLPFSTYAPRGGGGGQASYTLRITCKKGEGGGGSRKHVKLRTY